MPKYVFAYHGGSLPDDEAARADGMAAWGAWLGSLGDALVDVGHPISTAKTLAADGTTSDGGGANPLSGYSLVTATDLDAALTLAKGCPILSGGGSVEVAETVEM